MYNGFRKCILCLSLSHHSTLTFVNKEKEKQVIKTKYTDRVVLVTTTFSPSLQDMRAQLALKTCTTAVAHGYRIVVVDGSPSIEFKEALRATGACVLDQVLPGMGASRREVISAGLEMVESNTGVIVWLEPEKHSLVSLLDECVAPIVQGFADVVIPRRRSFDNYPLYQQWSELTANWLLGDITGRRDLDFYSGPRIMTCEAARLMMSYNGRCGENQYNDRWEILFVPLLWFIEKGLRIVSVTVNYVHPTEQLIEDDLITRAKRDEQRTSLVATMRIEMIRLGLKPVVCGR